MAKIFGLKGMLLLILLLITLIIKSSCNLKSGDIEGEYYHYKLGKQYTLILKDGIFIQTLIINNKDTFINKGNYKIELNFIKCYYWKSRDLLITTPRDKGGCSGCGLKYRKGKLYYYEDPDTYEDIFLRI